MCNIKKINIWGKTHFISHTVLGHVDVCCVWSVVLRSNGTSSAVDRCTRNSTSSATSILLPSIITRDAKVCPQIQQRAASEDTCTFTTTGREKRKMKERKAFRDTRTQQTTGLNSTSSYCSYQSYTELVPVWLWVKERENETHIAPATDWY